MILVFSHSVRFYPFYIETQLFVPWLHTNKQIYRRYLRIFHFSRYPDWKEVAEGEIDVRPPQHLKDNALYIDGDDDVRIVKMEGCEHRPIFVKSSKPCLASPILMTISSDSDSDFEDLSQRSEDHDIRIPGRCHYTTLSPSSGIILI